MVPANQVQTPVTININPIALKFTLLGVLFTALVVGAPFLVEFMWNNVMAPLGLPVFGFVNAAALILWCLFAIVLVVSTVVIIKELL